MNKPKIEAIFRLIDGSTFHAEERMWITDEGPEMVKVRGWFESELGDAWLEHPPAERLFLNAQNILWWQEPDQVEANAR